MTDNSKSKEVKTIDDYFQVDKAQMDKAFKHYDEHMHEDKQNHLFNNIIAPAQDNLYKVISGKLDKIFDKNDTAKINKKEKDVKKAVVEGLKEYFKTVRPQVNKIIDEIKDEDEQYNVLTTYYDNELTSLGQDNNSDGVYNIRTLIESAIKDKNHNVGKLKKTLYNQKSQHANRLQQNYSYQKATELIKDIHPSHIASYLKDHLGNKGIEIKSPGQWYTKNVFQLLAARESSLGQEAKDKLEKHGLAYKPQVKKK